MNKFYKTCVLLFVLLLLITGCSSEGTVSNSGADTISLANSQNTTIKKPSIEENSLFTKKNITLSDVVFSVVPDDKNNLYIAGGNKVVILDSNYKERIFAEGLMDCMTLAYVDNKLYVSDASQGYTITAYDESGEVQKRYSLELPEGSSIYRMVPFTGKEQLCLVVYIDKKQFLYLYDLKKQKMKLINIKESSSVYPLSNGMIVVTRSNGASNSILTISSWDKIEEKKASKVFQTQSGFYDDQVTGQLYKSMINVNSEMAMVMIDSKSQAETILPALSSLDEGIILISQCINDKMYAVSKNTIYIGDLAKLRETANNKQVLRVYRGFSCSELDEYLKYYQDKYPKVQIDFIDDSQKNDVFAERIGVEVLSGELKIDIFVMDSSQAYRLINAGLVKDLSDMQGLVKTMENPSIMDGLKNYCTANGIFFGVPISLNYGGYVVNKELFNKLNIEPPDIDWTFADYYKLAQTSRKDLDNDGKSDTYLFYNYFYGLNVLPHYGINAANNYKVCFDTPEYLDYLKRSLEIMQMNVAYYDPSIGFSPSEWSDKDMLWRINISDLPNIYSRLNSESLIIPEQPRTIINGTVPEATFMSITTNAQNPQLAAAFLEEFMSEEYQRENALTLQLYKDLSKYSKMSKYPDCVERWTRKVLSNAVNVSLPPGFWPWINIELAKKYETENLSPEECVQMMQEEAKKRMLG